jgi:Ca-activated chloride channel family protein
MAKTKAMNKRFLLALAILASFTTRAFFGNESITITGRVTDEQNLPLTGVTVSELGVNNQVLTDSNGIYKLQISHPGAKLRISYPGYQVVEFEVNATLVKNISLKTISQGLKETVVMGYSMKMRNTITPGTILSKQPYTYDVIAPADYEQEQEPADYNREGYDAITENRFKKVTENPLSTFSIDVDAASYTNVRRMITNGILPPAGAVRIEEMINYFHYDYPQPMEEHPFSITTEITNCPWNEKHQIALIGLQGKKVSTEKLPPSNLVFLIDVSGSMNDENKLPLVKVSLKLLAEQLREKDRVAIVVYAGNAGLVLPPTNGADKKTINKAIDHLEAGGSTAGSAGIKLAYKTASEYFMKEGNNRVILCTDGDFNVGASSDDELERMIEMERGSGIYLSVLGFGMGNYQDAKMQKLADKGNGNHNYIDNLNEAKKVLVNEFGGTLFTIAKDVKLQVEFNPSKVQSYRLIGYENRVLNKEDFNNDKKDAGELGSGHTVTALYEIIPTGVVNKYEEETDDLKYQKPLNIVNGGNELMTIKFRYKDPAGTKSKLIIHPVVNEVKPFEAASNNIQFAASVAEFGMLLRNSEFKQKANYNQLLSIAQNSKGNDTAGYRKEFIELVKKAAGLKEKAGDKNDLGVK